MTWHASGTAGGAGLGGVLTSHVHESATDAAASASQAGLTVWILTEGARWMLMVIGMMTVVMVPRIRRVARACIGRHRFRAIVSLLAGAFSAWALVGVAALVLVATLPPLDARTAPLAFAGVWAAVALWQFAPAKSRALARCHGVALAAGPRDGRQFEPGVAYGGWCIVSCGPAMLAMAVTGHPLVVMAALTAGFTAERIVFQPAKTTRRVAVLTLAAAAATIGLAALFG